MKLQFLFSTLMFVNNLCGQGFSGSSAQFVDFMTGKVLHGNKESGSEENEIRFVGMEVATNKPFKYNACPGYGDCGWKKWESPENRFIFKVRYGNNGPEQEFIIYDVNFIDPGYYGQAVVSCRKVTQRNGSQISVGPAFTQYIRRRGSEYIYCSQKLQTDSLEKTILDTGSNR
jgi:hypothetical protein